MNYFFILILTVFLISPSGVAEVSQTPTEIKLPSQKSKAPSEENHEASFDSEGSDTSHSEEVETPEPEVVQKKRPVYIRRKDEGTKAREYFKANTVPKSFYKLNGRTLDVDPD